MHTKPWMRRLIAAICLGSMLLPPELQAAGKRDSLPAVRDVVLDADGSLRGTLMSVEGKPQANVPVALRRGNEVVGTATTNQDGTFAIANVRPGFYELAALGSANLYRVWTARSAPPSAQAMALLVHDSRVVRGQDSLSALQRALILGGIVVTSGVIGGVIGYNVKDDDDAS